MAVNRGDKHLCNLSTKGTQHNIETLTNNLLVTKKYKWENGSIPRPW